MPKKGYTKYIIMASRLKPAYIDSMPTHKDLLRLYLNSRSNPAKLSQSLYKCTTNPKDATKKGLDQIVKIRKQELLFA